MMSISPDIWISGSIAMAFLWINIIFIIALMSNRAAVTGKVSSSRSPKNRIKNYLGTIVVLALEGNKSNKEIDEACAYLFAVSKKSQVLAQYLIDQLLDLHKNLSGGAAQVLQELFIKLQLSRFSMKKLDGLDNAQIIRGIQELTEMYGAVDVRGVENFLHHEDATVRLEARVAMVLLRPKDPLYCIKNMSDPMSRWEKIRLYNGLKKLSPKNVPDFKSQFHNANHTVVCFCIEMAVRFLQYNAVNELVVLTSHRNHRIALEAINGLKLLEASQCSGQIMRLLRRTKNPKVLIACLECLAEIGDPEELFPLFRKIFSASFSPDIKRALSKIFVEWDQKGIDKLSQVQFDRDGELLVSHFSDPLIN